MVIQLAIVNAAKCLVVVACQYTSGVRLQVLFCGYLLVDFRWPLPELSHVRTRRCVSWARTKTHRVFITHTHELNGVCDSPERISPLFPAIRGAISVPGCQLAVIRCLGTFKDAAPTHKKKDMWLRVRFLEFLDEVDSASR